MAAIVEFTSFDRNAVDETFKVDSIQQLSVFPNVLVLLLTDYRPGAFQAGDKFTYENGNLKFSAIIKKVVAKSLHIDYPENWQQYVNVRGGVIYLTSSEEESLNDQPLVPVKEISSTRTLLTILGIVAGLAILTSIFNKSKKK